MSNEAKYGERLFVTPPEKLEYGREYRKKNAELIRAKDRERDKIRYATTPRNQWNADRRRKRKAETMAANQAKRREWLRSGDVTIEQLRIVAAADEGRCHYCHVPVKTRCHPIDLRGFDHVIPRASGGKHTMSNLVVCCMSCNALRGTELTRVQTTALAAKGEDRG